MKPVSQKAHIVHVLYSFSTGGIEKSIVTLVNQTSDRYEHTIVCLTRSGRFEDLLPEGTRVISMNKAPGNSLFFLFRLARVLKGLKPDIVHTLNWSGLDGVIAARLAGIKNIVHGERGWGMDDPYGQNFKRRWIRKILSFLVREYICVSWQIQEWLATTIRVARPVNLIYNGVDTGTYAPGNAGKKGKSFHVGMVGRLDPIKNHDTLIRAFQSIADKIPEARLSIIGDGPQRNHLETMAEGDSRIQFLGDRPDVPELLKSLDVFVLCSLNEGISNTILEAMATGLPCIVTNVGGNPEIVTDQKHGRLFSPGDWKTLAQYLLDYYKYPETGIAHGRAGRQKVMADFSVDAMVNGYIQVWERYS